MAFGVMAFDGLDDEFCIADDELEAELPPPLDLLVSELLQAATPARHVVTAPRIKKRETRVIGCSSMKSVKPHPRWRRLRKGTLPKFQMFSACVRGA